jgi:excisionase family DNA binding protein
VTRLLTTREVADQLGLSPATVLRRWRAGEIPGYRLASNCLRFDPDELASWLQSTRAAHYSGATLQHARSEASGPALSAKIEADPPTQGGCHVHRPL